MAGEDDTARGGNQRVVGKPLAREAVALHSGRAHQEAKVMLDEVLEEYPKQVELGGDLPVSVRPLRPEDEMAFHEFFIAVPERERMFIKHKVTDPAVIREWCQKIDLGHKLPLLAFGEGRILGCSTLHQQLGGWKRHIGRVSVLVHPLYRGRGLARLLVGEVTDLSHRLGLEKLEAEFLADQAAAIKVFAMLGFSELMRRPHYVKDMQAVSHDYILMGLDLETDEEYAGMG
jgi:RimJ/RimL family protein N-acetyltransferase